MHAHIHNCKVYGDAGEGGCFWVGGCCLQFLHRLYDIVTPRVQITWACLASMVLCHCNVEL